MEQQTNPLKLAAFFSEAMPYVSMWTPTKVNDGGCGIFAQALCDELDKHNIEHKIYCLYFTDDEPGFNESSNVAERSTKQYIQNGSNLKTAGADHIMVLIEDTLFVDSTGIGNSAASIAADKLEISRKVLDDMVAKGTWNPTFDRACTPCIKKYMHTAFERLNDFELGCLKMPPDRTVKLTDHTMHYMRKSFGGGLFGSLADILS